MTDNLIERLRGYGDGNNDLMDAAADRIEKLEDELHHCFHRINELQAALRPFAEWADSYEPDEGDGHEVAWAHDATIGMLRAARAALEGKDD